MKAYKIAVPVADVIHGQSQTITSQEIHELVRNHAEKLGYKISDDGYEYNINEPYIILYEDLTVYTEHKETVFNDCKFQEISWQDFLKLTPEDVQSVPDTKQIMTIENDNTLHNSNKQVLLEAYTAGCDAAHNNRFSIGVNFDKWYHEKAETIKNLRGKYKNYLNPTTNDRNEKAWFTVQINGEWFKNSIDVYCEKDIELAKEMLKIVSDNFIKQVGNK